MNSLFVTRRVAAAASLLALLAVPGVARASGRFPEPGQTLRLVVPFAAGGGVDNAARLLADQLRRQTGAAVLVENRAGASGTVGGRFVQTAAPDGLTLLFSAATHIHARNVLKNAPYDPLTDFVPVARVGEAPLMLVVAPRHKGVRLGPLLASAARDGGNWTAAIPAAGAPSHLATLLMARQGQARLTYVPYKGTQPALTDVAGGHVDLLLDSMISLLPLAKAGTVVPVAVSAARRSPLAPEVPTMMESGLPRFSYGSWYGVWAPKGLPTERVQALNLAIQAAVAELDRSGAFVKLGIESVRETPEQTRQFIAAQVVEGAELLKAANFNPE
jgi:tripartite-type tricarboxylate transporter receptor subunit TctC